MKASENFSSSQPEAGMLKAACFIAGSLLAGIVKPR